MDNYVADDPYTVSRVTRNATLREWKVVIEGREQRTESADNDRMVRNHYSKGDMGGPEDVVALFAPGRLPADGGRRLAGRDALLAFYGRDGIIAQGVDTVESVLVSGDSVAVEGRFAGILTSGAEANLRFADFFRLTDRPIVERNTYFAAPLV